MKQRGRKSAVALAVVPAQPAAVPLGISQKAPPHLSTEAKSWWRSVVEEYDLEPHHLRLLQCAAEAWDRMQQARKAIWDHGGLTFTDAGGNLKAHPAVSIEKDARIAFARLVRELDLDASTPAERGRPPALRSNRRGYAG